MEPAESEPPVAAPSIEADEAAIRELVRRTDETLTAGDVEAFVALFVDDGIEMPPDGPAQIGQDAIRSREGAFLGTNDTEVRTTVENIQIRGDLAVVRDSYTESWTPKDGGDSASAVGKGLMICHRQADGSWKLGILMWNSDVLLGSD